MIEKTNKDAIVLWQTGNEDMPVAEPALLFNPLSDAFYLSQEGSDIIINYETIPDLIKALKELKKASDDR